MKLSHADVLELFAVAKLAGDFGQVRRLTEHPDGERESDATHTVMLTLIAAQLAVYQGLHQHEVVMHALVHDLAEAYAGDTPTLHPLSPEERAAKEKREADALAKICHLTPYIGSLVTDYEQRTSAAARFVWVLDKAMPKLTHAWNGCAVPKRHGMTLEDLRANHREQGAKLRMAAPDVDVAHEFFDAACRHAEAAYQRDTSKLLGEPASDRRQGLDTLVSKVVADVAVIVEGNVDKIDM